MTITLPNTTRTQALINGELVDATTGETYPTFAPGTGEVLANIAAGSAADIDAAVVAARRTFDSGVWSNMAAAERKTVLLRFADLIAAHTQELAFLDAVEAGKPITDCEEGELPGVISTVRWYAEAIDKVFGKVAPTGSESLGIVVKEPIGVVGIVVPWNFPLDVLVLKLAPALAAGNSVVVKPPPQAALSAIRFGELALTAGIPAGVVNVVPGLGHTAGAALGLHPDVDALAFTGSTAVGRKFLRYSADSNLKEVGLELGGKSPQLVTASMRDELELVAADLAEAAFWNAGQNCTAGSRILVDNTIKDEFTQILGRLAASRKVGDPLDRDTVLGPLIEPAALDRALRYVHEAKSTGAGIVTGGERLLEESGGWYLGATVVTDVAPTDPIARDEIFAPIVAVLGFDTEQEAIALANDTDYGLAATVWSRDSSQAIRIARAIRAGTVAINGYSEGDITTPFGGYRTSGFGGRDKGLEAFDQYTATKTIWLSL